MKTQLAILVVAAGLWLGTGAQGALINLASGTLNATIPDANTDGYQSTLTFNNSYYDRVLDVNVKLHFSGGYNGDLYVYLTHGSGLSVLLNRVGRTSADAVGYGDAGFNITLDDGAGADIHTYGGNGGNQLTGVWQPDARHVNPATVTDGSSRTAYLDTFDALNPNGTWTLFIADLSGQEQSTLVSWELDITAVPEPTTLALGIFSALAALGCGWRAWRFLRRKRAAV